MSTVAVTPTRRPGLMAALDRRLAALADGVDRMTDALAHRSVWPAMLALVASLVGAGITLGTAVPSL